MTKCFSKIIVLHKRYVDEENIAVDLRTSSNPWECGKVTIARRFKIQANSIFPGKLEVTTDTLGQHKDGMTPLTSGYGYTSIM